MSSNCLGSVSDTVEIVYLTIRRNKPFPSSQLRSVVTSYSGYYSILLQLHRWFEPTSLPLPQSGIFSAPPLAYLRGRNVHDRAPPLLTW